jgi:hypothetical protein
MGVTRYTDGTTTIDLGGAVEEYVRRVALATHAATLDALEAGANEVAEAAAARWYSAEGVKWRTGRSGKTGVVTTITPTEIRVTFGSTDLKRAKYIRRSGPLSVVNKYVTQGEWWEHKKAGKKVGRSGTTGVQNWAIRVPSPFASDGKFLLQEFIGKPARALAKRINATLPAEIAAEVRNGRRG